MIIIKKKILFGITSLTIGGAERVLVDLANKLSEIYDITIFSIYDNGELKSELRPNIKFTTLYKCRYDELNKISKSWAPLRVLLFSSFIYNKYVKNYYDIEIAFLEGPITRVFSTKNRLTRKIAWIHNDIKQVFGYGWKARIKKKIDKNIYNKYDNLVFVSNQNMQSFQSEYQSIDKKKMEVIYNYIDSSKIKDKANEYTTELLDCPNTKFVSVCRLVKQKAIDRLIRIHKEILNEGLMHEFFVIGDGPEKDYLEGLVKNYNVEKTFHLLGKKKNPYPYIKEADYFCLLSHFEGYGMVLEEAKALSKKIIITDTAAKEAVKNYQNSMIIENNERMIHKALTSILNNTYKFGNMVKDDIKEDSINKIIVLFNRK